MIRIVLIPFALFVFSCTNSKTPPNIPPPSNVTNTTSTYNYTFATAHPNAQALMKEDFFWSAIEETGPFGSDDGTEAAWGFHNWRKAHATTSPLVYLKELQAQWHYPYFDWHEMDTNAIKNYIAAGTRQDEAYIQQQMHLLKNTSTADTHHLSDGELREVVIESSKSVNGLFLLGQDNAIIATGFAQFVLEGKIAPDLKELTITAINRQLLPVLINRYDAGYKDKRKQQLTKMLNVIEKS